jgi:hypothetical protein
LAKIDKRFGRMEFPGLTSAKQRGVPKGEGIMRRSEQVTIQKNMLLGIILVTPPIRVTLPRVPRIYPTGI